MDMRLAYRIAIDSRADPRLVHEIQKSPKFILDGVASLFGKQRGCDYDLSADVPNFAPPFSSFWAEWNEPPEHIANNMSVPANSLNPKIQRGYLCKSIDLSNLNKEALDNLQSKCRYDLARIKWILVTNAWASPSFRPYCGEAVQIAVSHIFYIEPSGLIAHFGVRNDRPDLYDDSSLGGETLMTTVLGFGISFMHCKNVAVTEREDNRGERWHKRSKTPVLKFYTLDINPMKQVLRTEGKSEETGIKKALHICRGHFATYTPDHPLFGKYVGTYWRPDHVRGHAPAGIIEKDYRVNV